MTAYHVDRYYGKDDEFYYASIPYNLKGTLLVYFGIELYPFKFRIRFIPWYSRYTGFLKFIMHTRLSEKSANKLAERLTKKEKDDID